MCNIFQNWRLCYYVGGGLGLLLLLLRVSVSESGMFNQMKENTKSKGNFFALFTNRRRVIKYFQCILIGVPLWFLVGVLITFSPEFAKVLNIRGFENVQGGTAIAWCYGGLVLGDMASGLLSQLLKSRKKVMFVFLVTNLLMVFIYLNSFNISLELFYFLCLGMGFSVGYWVIFVTIAAEQFGTNIRSTVTTTVPNFVRGSLPIIILAYKFFRDKMFENNILYAGMAMGIILSGISLLALWGMRETFHQDLNYSEDI